MQVAEGARKTRTCRRHEQVILWIISGIRAKSTTARYSKNVSTREEVTVALTTGLSTNNDSTKVQISASSLRIITWPKALDSTKVSQWRLVARVRTIHRKLGTESCQPRIIQLQCPVPSINTREVHQTITLANLLSSIWIWRASRAQRKLTEFLIRFQWSI